MSCFNALANCCPTEPPPENCCLELSDIATLFPNGASLIVGGVTFTFPAGGWYKEGCCLYNTSTSFTGGVSPQCTSDWTYEATETIKCNQFFQKTKRIQITSPEPPAEQPDLCQYSSCEDIFLGTTATASVLEKGERVVVSKAQPISATLVIGKYLRSCAYGQSVCTYVVGVVLSYAVSMKGEVHGYKTFNQTLDYIHPDILAACHPGVTDAEMKASFAYNFTQGSNDFPYCNYVAIDDLTPQEIVTITRGKLLTTWNCPLTFTEEDIDLDFCNWIALCIDPKGDQGPITVTFNRTLPPVYVGINPYMVTFDFQECCTTHVIDNRYIPPFAWSVFGPATKQTGSYWTFDPPPPGQQFISNCYPEPFGSSCIGIAACYNGPEIFTGGCFLPWPTEGTIYVGPYQCCPNQTTIGSLAVIKYYSQEFSDYAFSYNSVTDSTPIVHTYNIPAWTLNC